MSVDLYREGVEIPEAVWDRAVSEAQAEAGDIMEAFSIVCRKVEETGAYYRLNNTAWEKALILAHGHGWQPHQPAEAYWHTTVDEAEARELADALEAAGETLRNVEPMHGPNAEVDIGGGVKAVAARDDLEPVAFWANAPERLEGLAEFARAGAFRIE